MSTTTEPTDLFGDRFHEMSRDTLLSHARRQKWFHNMRLGDFETGSWVYGNDLPPNYHLFPTFQFFNALDLRGATCLDIGTYDGMGAFSLAVRGAARVDGSCQYDLDRFRIARALLGLRNVAYYPQTDLALIHKNTPAAQYDVVVMTAMLHHLLSPLEGLLEARRLLKRGGYLVIEVSVQEGGKADVRLNTALEDPVIGVPTIWIPSAGAVTEMLRFAGFNPVAEIHLVGGKAAREPNYDRVTFLAQAVARAQISGRSEKLIEIHNNIETLGGYSYVEFDSAQPVSGITVKDGLEPVSRLDIWSHKPEDPLQPAFTAQAKDPAVK